jgi:PAS domain-containing protein
VFYPEQGHYDNVFLDITERRQAAEALKEGEEKFRSLVEGSLEGILVMVEDRVAYANQAAADVFG